MTSVDEILHLYRNAINALDDYFEYRCQSEQDQKYVHGVLNTLTTKLKAIDSNLTPND